MILWLNPFSGLSGDMLLGALLDLGAPLDQVRAAIATTGLTGWTLDAERRQVHGIAATKAVVDVHDDATSRQAAELLDRVRQAEPAPVAKLAAAAVTALAETEGALHGVPPEQVHLHEVGGLDTVVDTVGSAAALHLLGVDQVHSAPLAMGTGVVHCAHGTLPAPAPATMALLAGAQVRGIDVTMETVTPTGAAMLRAAGTVYGPLPAMSVQVTGYGAGTRQLPDQPNILPATLGTPLSAASTEILLETNVDDVTGEVLGHAIAAVIAAGAADAWATPAVMKKGRPAHVVHVLCATEHVAGVEAVLLAETGSLGLRRSTVQKVALHRHTTTVDVGGHQIRVKHGPWRAKPEYADLATAAATLGLPLREVAARAEQAIQAANQQ